MEFENMLSYCRELELNNNRSWFHANHERYRQAKAQFTELVETLKFVVAERADAELMERLLPADPAAMLYRIPRDARVYKDKPPYNPSWRAYISPDKKQMLPLGYFVMISPGGRSELGTGAWAPDGAWLRRTRDFIAENWEELEELIDESGLELVGEKLKRMPRDFPPDHPAGELLKHKEWLFLVNFHDEELRSFDDFAARVGDTVERMEPLRRFLNRAMQDRGQSMWERLYRSEAE